MTTAQHKFKVIKGGLSGQPRGPVLKKPFAEGHGVSIYLADPPPPRHETHPWLKQGIFPDLLEHYETAWARGDDYFVVFIDRYGEPKFRPNRQNRLDDHGKNIDGEIKSTLQNTDLRLVIAINVTQFLEDGFPHDVAKKMGNYHQLAFTPVVTIDGVSPETIAISQKRNETLGAAWKSFRLK